MNFLRLQKIIVPEIVAILELRYNILRNIYHNQPIGRRRLSQELRMEERPIRTEVKILKEQGLLNIRNMGMYVTERGKEIIDNLSHVMRELKGIFDLENRLEDILGIQDVSIVPGDSMDNSLILRDIGKTTSMHLKDVIEDNSIIGITGGTTLAQVAEELTVGKVAENVLVIPARGGLGREVETQSNNIAAKLAKKLDASYRLLHVPDNLDEKALKVILKIPEVKEVVELIHHMDILVFGIGRVDTMARRRQLPVLEIDRLSKEGAVGEAFGHYFDIKGKDIWKSITVGISLEDYNKINKVIGVAGGEDKAEAIMAIASLRKDMCLITDEGAARKIISIVNKANC